MNTLRKISEVLQEVYNERERQNTKWGEQNHNMFIWGAILGEEVGECAKATLDAHFHSDEGHSYTHLREELIQVAAVAVAMVESLDRNELKEK